MTDAEATHNRVMLDLEIKNLNMGTQLTIPFEETKVSPKYWNVPFVNEVEEFNSTFGKPNNYEPTIPERKEWMFVYDFIQEELAEYKEACENGDIVEILDALCDITYVSLGNGAMLHGLKGKIWNAYQEVQASNMSKACKTEEEAIETAKSEAARVGEDTHYEQVGEYWVVYRSRDRKVLKSINYFRPNLKQFFTDEELKQNS
jgi:predicted HAD superfamily Cof-like phosphohydrolase|tara:strand:+ start:714 stop:1322 length:609 start_codon:yes stop_codon:yes gene_type:complete